jgi:phospholipid/cholesterol/gamma-HCH transport system permease protein
MSLVENYLSLFISIIIDFINLFFQTLFRLFSPPFRWKEILKQIAIIGFDSAPMILFCVVFAAIVTIIEASFHMKIVLGDDSLVPGFAAVLILRELGVVVTALLITSKVGAGITAEVGSMQITEQIDALKMLGIDPIQYLVVPRFIATALSLFMLTFLANIACLYSAMLISEIKLGFSSGMFVQSVRAFVDMKDLMFAGVKGIVFGAVIPLFSCSFGFRCKAGAEGVGSATTNSVVASSVAIIFLDFVLSFVFSFFY